MEEISDNTINGECSGCGRCCTDVLLLSNEEIWKIKKYLNNHPEIRPVNRSLFVDKIACNICPFLQKNNKCSIYDIRPRICKNFLCSEYCKHKDEDTYNMYRHIKVISMIRTFFPDEKIYGVKDLTTLQKKLEELQKKIYGD